MFHRKAGLCSVAILASAVALLSPERGTAQNPEPKAVQVNIQVPADADVWIGDAMTKQKGANRSFVSPPLKANQSYTYEIRARWMENGKPVDWTRRLVVRAGETFDVNFNSLGRSYSGTATAAYAGPTPVPSYIPSFMYGPFAPPQVPATWGNTDSNAGGQR
jgi:uncharacterized protein (TIGR03000 family)